jgi:predicted unusual protein kinase regulating ubiquinone biosynthesis (AarF/ABC1/UbiB family)
MKTIDYIPTSKIERATKLVQTGAKVGVNYLKYYGEKVVNPSLNRDKLNENNAEDIYDGLKSLKGSALKVAQMLSMDRVFYLKRMWKNSHYRSFQFLLFRHL